MEGTLLPPNMRPDLSGAIVMLNQLQWQGEDVIVAVARGARQQHLHPGRQRLHRHLPPIPLAVSA